MTSTYIYYPRSLRHLNDFYKAVKDFGDTEVSDSFFIKNISFKGLFIEIVLFSIDNKTVSASYFRFGFLKVISSDEINEDVLNRIRSKLWSFAFINSVISTLTFQKGLSAAGTAYAAGVGPEFDVSGFCKTVVQIIDKIGDHNRELFKSLDLAYTKSPYSKFLKLVQSDTYSCLPIYLSRLHHIEGTIIDFSNIYSGNISEVSIGEIENVKSETKYLINLVKLTMSFYEKRYNSALHIKQNRQTRFALIISILAFIAAIYAIYLDTSSSLNSDRKKTAQPNNQIPILPSVKMDSTGSRIKVISKQK